MLETLFYVGVIIIPQTRIFVYIVDGKLVSDKTVRWRISLWEDGEKTIKKLHGTEIIDLKTGKVQMPVASAFLQIDPEGMLWEMLDNAYSVTGCSEEERLEAQRNAELITSGLSGDEQLELLEEIGLLYPEELN